MSVRKLNRLDPHAQLLRDVLRRSCFECGELREIRSAGFFQPVELTDHVGERVYCPQRKGNAMTTFDAKYAELAGRDFVCVFEEHAGVYVHVLRVLHDHYRTKDGIRVPGLVVNAFRVAIVGGKKTRTVIGASNERADWFLSRHREVSVI